MYFGLLLITVVLVMVSIYCNFNTMKWDQGVFSRLKYVMLTCSRNTSSKDEFYYFHAPHM